MYFLAVFLSSIDCFFFMLKYFKNMSTFKLVETQLKLHRARTWQKENIISKQRETERNKIADNLFDPLFRWLSDEKNKSFTNLAHSIAERCCLQSYIRGIYISGLNNFHLWFKKRKILKGNWRRKTETDLNFWILNYWQ